MGTEPVHIAQNLIQNVGQVLRGKEEVIRLAVIGLLARGHILIEDVPGVGKTSLARALAQSIGVNFRRVQFTSDLMPADVVGGNIYDPNRAEFEFRPGPVFTNVLLADEINRTTPKTQSALLEAMEEGQVSIEGTTYPIEPPFFVLATQNPEDFFGTFPLPESQLDRFLFRLRIGYPSAEVERELMKTRGDQDPFESLNAVTTREELREAQQAVEHIRVEPLIIDYLHEIILETRKSSLLSLGASTRAGLALERAARAAAVVEGRDHVLPDDVQSLAVSALAHRVRLGGATDAAAQAGDTEAVVRDIVSSVPVPV